MKAKDRNVRIFLEDILDNISRIERFTKNLSSEEFRSDEKTYFATLQCIGIIGDTGHDAGAGDSGGLGEEHGAGSGYD